MRRIKADSWRLMFQNSWGLTRGRAGDKQLQRIAMHFAAPFRTANGGYVPTICPEGMCSTRTAPNRWLKIRLSPVYLRLAVRKDSAVAHPPRL